MLSFVRAIKCKNIWLDWLPVDFYCRFVVNFSNLLKSLFSFFRVIKICFLANFFKAYFWGEWGLFGMAVMPLLCRGVAKKSCKSHTENAKLGRKYGFLYFYFVFKKAKHRRVCFAISQFSIIYSVNPTALKKERIPKI